MNLRKISLLFGTLFFAFVLIKTFDFTPRFHKDIITAQDKIRYQDYSGAIKLYQKILRGNPPSDIKMKINYQLGDLYSIYQNKNVTALKYYRKVKKDTQDPLWLVKTEERVGEINFTYLKDYRESIKSYELLSNFTPRLERQDFYQSRLALSYFKDNNYLKSEELFRQILQNPSHEYFVKSYYQLGLIHFNRKNWKDSIKFLNEYIKMERRKDAVVQAKYIMANAYETMEKLKTAYNIYYSLLGEYPNTEVIRNRLNSIYSRRIARKR